MAANLTEFPIVTKKISELTSGSTLDGAETVQVIQSSVNRKVTVDDFQTKILTSSLKTVSNLADLPTPASGVITLLEDTTYFFTAVVDLEGNRLVAQEGTSIIGSSSENAKILSTGLVSALITSNYTLPIRYISLEAALIFDLDATANANQVLDFIGVNFVNSAVIGTIEAYDSFVYLGGAFLASGELTFDGSIGTVAFDNALLNTDSTQTLITLASTLTITRRFRINQSALIIESGETGIDFVSGATLPNEGLIINGCNFSGAGTYLNGITSSDDEARFIENRGITNSVNAGQLYMNNNATATAIAVSGTYYKVSGTTTAGTVVEGFTHTSGRLTYNGALTAKFKASATMSFTGTNNKVLRFRIAKNGTTIASTQMSRTINASGAYANMNLQDIVELAANDYIEIFCTNSTDTNTITVSDLNLIVEES